MLQAIYSESKHIYFSVYLLLLLYFCNIINRVHFKPLIEIYSMIKWKKEYFMPS